MLYSVELHETFPPGASLYGFEMEDLPGFHAGEWIVNPELEADHSYGFLIKSVMWQPRRNEDSQLDSMKVCLLVEKKKLLPQIAVMEEHATRETAATL